MKRNLACLDTEVFARTASIFSTKRATLDPETVKMVAHEIVHRLARSPVPLERADDLSISPESLAEFCDALILPDPGKALRFIENRRAQGISLPGVYIGYISGGARHLGERWDRDDLSFVQVTTGTGHLYALMRALREEISFAQRKFDDRRSALFATVPGEDHGIGITVAADLFRQAGWEIDLETGTDHDELVAHVNKTHPHIIGLSISSEQRMGALVRLVVATRLLVPDAIIGVAPPSSVDANRLNKLVDIDLVFSDAQSAVRELDRLVRLHCHELTKLSNIA